MRLHRFYVTQPLGEEVVVDDDSLVKQWVKVFRYQEGDLVILFNGDGHEHLYRLNEITRTTCMLLREESHPSYIPPHKSYLFLAIIKKDLFELAVEKATECGVTHIIPVLSSRTEKKNLDTVRLSRILKEASEQSGRGDIPTLENPMDIATALAYATSVTKTIYAGSLYGKPLTTIEKGDKACFIGPEGGWTDEEERLFTTTCIPVSFGKTVLRAETAAILASGYLGLYE